MRIIFRTQGGGALYFTIATSVALGLACKQEQSTLRPPSLIDAISESRSIKLRYVIDHGESSNNKGEESGEMVLEPCEPRFGGLLSAIRYGRFEPQDAREWSPVKGTISRPSKDVWILIQSFDNDETIIAVYPAGYVSSKKANQELFIWRGANLRAFLPMLLCPCEASASKGPEKMSGLLRRKPRE